MIDLKNLDDLARKLSDLVPPGLKDARADLEQHVVRRAPQGVHQGVDRVSQGRHAGGRGRGRGRGAASHCLSIDAMQLEKSR